MASDKLDNLVRIGQLKKEPPSAVELAGLKRSGLARLADAERRDLSLMHEKRNFAEYEGYLEPDERLLADTLAATRALIAALRALEDEA